MRETAIIYIHGIGSRHRNQEISELLDSIDTVSQKADLASIGKARDFTYSEEESEVFDTDVSFIKFKRVVSINGEPRAIRQIKMYECLWSPHAINKYPVSMIIFWLFGQIFNPIKLLFSPWRSYFSYRLNCLHRILNRPNSRLSQKLEALYSDFEKWEYRKKFPKGSFSEFELFLRERSSPQDIDKLLSLSRTWKKSIYLSLTKRTIFFLSIFLIVMLFSFVGISTLYFCFLFALEVFNTGGQFEYIWNMLTQNYHIFLYAFCFLLIATATVRAFKDRIADVMHWTISAEKDERFKIKSSISNYVSDYIIHVVNKNSDADIFIVAHSLGSAIAVDCLSTLDRKRKIRTHLQPNPFEMIGNVRALITYGSPIDLVFDTFQIDSGQSHRYSRIEFQSRKSLSSFKYREAAHQLPLIYNFWSKFDPVSSRIFSPIQLINDGLFKIINIHADVPHCANPAKAHGGYIKNGAFIEFLYHCAMTGKAKMPQEVRIAPRIDIAIAILQLTMVTSLIASLIAFLLTIIDPQSAVLFWLVILLSLNIAALHTLQLLRLRGKKQVFLD